MLAVVWLDEAMTDLIVRNIPELSFANLITSQHPRRIPRRR